MKKITLCLIATFMLLTFIPVQSNAAVTDPPSAIIAENAKVPAEVKSLLLRLDEINGMDKTKLSSPEKKDLRKEVRQIKHQLSIDNGGIYLSAGAIIIILLLVIILL